MNKQAAIYTEYNNCQDCYKCIRHCPVKAIKIEDHAASIVPELCVFCGICTEVCPAGAKKIRNDVHAANYFLQQPDPVYLSLAPSYISDFGNYSIDQLVAAIRQLGFAGISETALGADYLSKEINGWLEQQHSGVFLSTCCPTVVELVQKYYPEHINKLTPFLSPAQCHANLLKKRNPKAKVVFAGPCIAKKTEVTFPGNAIDVVLTFRELQEMFDGAGVMPELLKAKSAEFYPFHAGNGRLYPVDGGMSNSLHPGIEQTSCSFMSFSGISRVQLLLDKLPESPNHPLFLELMACDGGCINGPGRLDHVNIVRARERILVAQNTNCSHNYDDWLSQHVEIKADFNFNNLTDVPIFSKAEIEETLSSIGKLSPEDELNCGGCGYSSCREFARAILEGKAERQMCVSYMRKMAQNKASVLLHKMPYGVVIVDDRLKVIESNQLFASIWGETSQLAYNAKPGLEGANIEKLTPLSRLFKNLLDSGHERIEKDISHNERRLHVSLFTIQKHKQVCAIVRVPGEHEEAVNDMVARLRKVIRENMQTAQRAASLIGENAANTECLINTVVDSFTGGSDYGKDVY